MLVETKGEPMITYGKLDLLSSLKNNNINTLRSLERREFEVGPTSDHAKMEFSTLVMASRRVAMNIHVNTIATTAIKDSGHELYVKRGAQDFYLHLALMLIDPT